ncbi:MAG: hypothetical protein HN341_10020 [Verrucomicrobia bacterium]|nr:hypothetical protein [Verrucomicrobiota bacterium]
MTKVEIREVHEADVAGVATFLAEFPGSRRRRSEWLERMGSWWDRNPAFVPGWPRGWMLTASARVVGFIGAIPTLMIVAGMQRPVCNAAAWYVSDGFRPHSLKLFRKLLHHFERDVVFDTTPNRRVVRLLPRWKFLTLPLPQTIGIVSADGGAPSASEVYVGTPTLRRQSLPGCGTSEGGGDSATGSFAQMHRADGRFDSLWSRTKGLYANTNVRTSRIINWQCFSNGPHKKLLFGISTRENVADYCVVVERTVHETGLRFLECVDMWGDAGADVSSRLLKGLCEFGISEGIGVIAVPAFQRCLMPYCGTLVDLRVGDQVSPHAGLIAAMAFRPARAFYRIAGHHVAHFRASESYLVTLQGDKCL